MNVCLRGSSSESLSPPDKDIPGPTYLRMFVFLFSHSFVRSFDKTERFHREAKALMLRHLGSVQQAEAVVAVVAVVAAAEAVFVAVAGRGERA